MGLSPGLATLGLVERGEAMYVCGVRGLDWLEGEVACARVLPTYNK